MYPASIPHHQIVVEIRHFLESVESRIGRFRVKRETVLLVVPPEGSDQKVVGLRAGDSVLGCVRSGPDSEGIAPLVFYGERFDIEGRNGLIEGSAGIIGAVLVWSDSVVSNEVCNSRGNCFDIVHG